MYERSEEYAELMALVIEEHPEDFGILGELGVTVDVLHTDKIKTDGGKEVLGECVKAQDIYGPYCPYNYIIVIHDTSCHGLTQEQMYMLMYHELLHIDVRDTPSGIKYKIRPHDAEDFRRIIRLYGIDWAKKGGEEDDD